MAARERACPFDPWAPLGVEDSRRGRVDEGGEEEFAQFGAV